MACTEDFLTTALRTMAAVIQEHREELTDLDRHIGDGDHGENLARGFEAVQATLDHPVEGPGARLSAVGTTLLSHVGGAAGPLLGTAFLRAAGAVGDRPLIDADWVASALEAAAAGVAERGRSSEGDKTMVDALAPAARAARTAAQAHDDPLAAVQAAASAAEQGAADTAPLQGRKGRASYLGERSIGYVDPGAQSVAYLLRAAAQDSH